eukprot:1353845-Amorphochlora_amoeboformis.AAC.2
MEGSSSNTSLRIDEKREGDEQTASEAGGGSGVGHHSGRHARTRANNGTPVGQTGEFGGMSGRAPRQLNDNNKPAPKRRKTTPPRGKKENMPQGSEDEAGGNEKAQKIIIQFQSVEKEDAVGGFGILSDGNGVSWDLKRGVFSDDFYVGFTAGGAVGGIVETDARVD